MQFAAALLGVLFIAAKDEVSAIPYNKNVGLKTKYTLAGEAVWRAAHLFWGQGARRRGLLHGRARGIPARVWSLAAAAASLVLSTVSAAVYAARRRGPEGRD